MATAGGTDTRPRTKVGVPDRGFQGAGFDFSLTSFYPLAAKRLIIILTKYYSCAIIFCD